MNKLVHFILTILALSLAAAPSRGAEVIQCAGVLGNSGEQGSSLVRFGESQSTPGIGVVADRYGALWDRGGVGNLNRYATDGRLLGSYHISGDRFSSDTIAAAGERLIFCLGRRLSTLSIDAPAGSTATPLAVEADGISLSSHEGWVGAWLGKEVFLVNAAGEKKTVATLPHGPQQVELGPDGTVYAVRDGKVYQVGAGEGPALAGSSPGDRMQFLDGYVYGAAWHSTIRRFNAGWQSAPGVVMGGNSGSFIGHVDEPAEIFSARGLCKLGPALYGISGIVGTLHLLEWREKESRLIPIRRIGAVPDCRALALDRQGRVWYLNGNWNWDDGPDSPLRYGIPLPDVVFAIAMQKSDSIVGYGRLMKNPAFIFGPMDKEVSINWFASLAELPDDAAAAAVSIWKQRRVLLLLQKSGAVTAVHISDAGKYLGVAGPVTFATSAPVRAWTSLVAVSDDLLLGAGDGNVIELAREGDGWKETRRMNAWGEHDDQKFGGAIWLSADSGRLWISDAARHRVICFDLDSRRELARFGTPGQAGDDLGRLNTPRVIAARGERAVVFDSGNQRLVKLEIRKK